MSGYEQLFMRCGFNSVFTVCVTRNAHPAALCCPHDNRRLESSSVLLQFTDSAVLSAVPNFCTLLCSLNTDICFGWKSARFWLAQCVFGKSGRWVESANILCGQGGLTQFFCVCATRKHRQTGSWSNYDPIRPIGLKPDLLLCLSKNKNINTERKVTWNLSEKRLTHLT